MSEGNDYTYISGIMESFYTYDEDKISVHIADFNNRIESIAQAKKITDGKKNTSIYYNFQRIKKSHQDLESAYTNYNVGSLDEKFSMMVKVDQIQKDLSAMEEPDDE